MLFRSEAKAKVEEKRKSLLEAIERDEFDTMKSRFEELQKDLYELGASVYQQAGATPGATPGGNGSSGNGASGAASSSGEDVIDAEFTESK